jgi:hypothetical protein
VACHHHGGGGHTLWHCRSCPETEPPIYGPTPGKHCTVLDGPALPEDETYRQKVHHVIADATEPVFANYNWDVQESACGRTVKVFLPTPFDSEHARACKRCVEQIGLRG